MYYRTVPTRSRGRGSGCSGRLLMAAAIAAFSLFSYFSSRQDNPVTGETQYIDITPEQEIALGLEAAPQMAAEFGGLDENAQDQALVDEVGNRIVQSSPAGNSPYQFDFHLLDDDQTINAFALPGGQIFITRALYDKLTTEGELAGLLLEYLVGALVEDANLAGPVVALRDRPGERPVLEGVVLDVHREVRLALHPREVLRYGPGDEHRHVAVHHLEAKVVVEPSRVVLVDHERLARCRFPGIDVPRYLRLWLRCLVEAALALVLFQAHV